MEYITNRPVDREEPLPETAEGMAASPWCHLWKNRLWPYRELGKGDVLYFSFGRVKAILWRTLVLDVRAFPYQSKSGALAEVARWHGRSDAPESGHCLTYKVTDAARVALPRPEGLALPQTGWLRGDDPAAREWLA